MVAGCMVAGCMVGGTPARTADGTAAVAAVADDMAVGMDDKGDTVADGTAARTDGTAGMVDTPAVEHTAAHMEGMELELP